MIYIYTHIHSMIRRVLVWFGIVDERHIDIQGDPIDPVLP